MHCVSCRSVVFAGGVSQSGDKEPMDAESNEGPVEASEAGSADGAVEGPPLADGAADPQSTANGSEGSTDTDGTTGTVDAPLPNEGEATEPVAAKASADKAKDGAKGERTPLSEDEQRYRDVLSFLGSDIKTPSGVPRDYKPQDHSIHPLFRIDLGEYGGPLDLLVYLIRKHEIDVFDIPIRFVTERYLEMLEVLRSLDIDVAAEFLVLAADLVHIKSKMLLPAKEGDSIEEPEEEAGDPRADLVRRLLEYQKYRDAAVELSDREQLGRDVFARQPPLLEGESDVDPGLKQVSIFKLVELMAGMIKKKPVRHEISYDHFNIAERMHFILRFGNSRGGRFLLVDLLEQVASRAELVVTFIGVLESTKLQLVRLQLDEAPASKSVWGTQPADGSASAAKTDAGETTADADETTADADETIEVAGPAPDDDAPTETLPLTAEAVSADRPPAEDAAPPVEGATPQDLSPSEAASSDADAATEDMTAAPAQPEFAGVDAPIAAASAETQELIREVEEIEREIAAQEAEEAALEERRAAAPTRVSEPWQDEPLPAIWVELTGKLFEGDIMDDYA